MKRKEKRKHNPDDKKMNFGLKIHSNRLMKFRLEKTVDSLGEKFYLFLGGAKLQFSDSESECE